jgi:hypothetical protein
MGIEGLVLLVVSAAVTLCGGWLTVMAIEGGALADAETDLSDR